MRSPTFRVQYCVLPDFVSTIHLPFSLGMLCFANCHPLCCAPVSLVSSLTLCLRPGPVFLCLSATFSPVIVSRPVKPAGSKLRCVPIAATLLVLVLLVSLPLCFSSSTDSFNHFLFHLHLSPLRSPDKQHDVLLRQAHSLALTVGSAPYYISPLQPYYSLASSLSPSATR